MNAILDLKPKFNTGVFEDLSFFYFTIQEQNGVYEKHHKEKLNYIVYFRDKKNNEYGIPIPDANIRETYYKKYVETIINELFLDVFPYFLFNNNSYLNIKCTFAEKEKIRKSLIKNKAIENNIVFQLKKIKIIKVDENTVKLQNDDSFSKKFAENSRFKEFYFRMENVGFNYFKDDLFKYTNPRNESMDDAIKRFYSIK